MMESEISVTQLLASKMEVGAMSQEMQLASLSWNRQEKEFSPTGSRRNTALPDTSVETHFTF